MKKSRTIKRKKSKTSVYLKKLIIIKTGHVLDIFSKDRDESGTKTNSAVLRLTNILNYVGARDAIYKEICVVLK